MSRWPNSSKPAATFGQAKCRSTTRGAAAGDAIRCDLRLPRLAAPLFLPVRRSAHDGEVERASSSPHSVGSRDNRAERADPARRLTALGCTLLIVLTSAEGSRSSSSARRRARHHLRRVDQPPASAEMDIVYFNSNATSSAAAQPARPRRTEAGLADGRTTRCARPHALDDYASSRRSASPSPARRLELLLPLTLKWAAEARLAARESARARDLDPRASSASRKPGTVPWRARRPVRVRPDRAHYRQQESTAQPGQEHPLPRARTAGAGALHRRRRQGDARTGLIDSARPRQPRGAPVGHVVAPALARVIPTDPSHRRKRSELKVTREPHAKTDVGPRASARSSLRSLGPAR